LKIVLFFFDFGNLLLSFLSSVLC